MSKRLSLAAAGLAAILPALAMSEPVRVQAAAPGPAQCFATSAAENAAAARATSRQRAAGNLPPVRADARLARAAAKHACDMARRGLMAHGGSRTRGPAQRAKGAGYRPAVTAENIAAGPFDLARVLGAWLLWSVLGRGCQPFAACSGAGSTGGTQGSSRWGFSQRTRNGPMRTWTPSPGKRSMKIRDSPERRGRRMTERR